MYYRVRVSVAHFPRDIMRSCRRVAGLSCVRYCICVYRYCGYRLALVARCWLVPSAVVGLWLALCFPLFLRVLLSVAVAI